MWKETHQNRQNWYWNDQNHNQVEAFAAAVSQKWKSSLIQNSSRLDSLFDLNVNQYPIKLYAWRIWHQCQIQIRLIIQTNNENGINNSWWADSAEYFKWYCVCVLACCGTGNTGQGMKWGVVGLLKWIQQECKALSAVLTKQNVTCCGDPISLSLSFLPPFHPLFSCRQQWAVITKLLFSLWALVTTLHSSPQPHSPALLYFLLSLSYFLCPSSSCILLFPPHLHYLLSSRLIISCFGERTALRGKGTGIVSGPEDGGSDGMKWLQGKRDGNFGTWNEIS